MILNSGGADIAAKRADFLFLTFSMKITGVLLTLIKKIDGKLILTFSAGLTATFITLMLTLNAVAAVLVFILTIAGLIFYKSFSRGWIFLLGIVLLFPAIKLNDSGLTLFVFLLSVLALIGMIKLALEDKKIIKNRLTFHFFLFFLIAASYLIFGKLLGVEISGEVWWIALNLLLIWMLLIGFQYFFQTQRRIKMFFGAVVATSTFHCLFGVVMYLSASQNSLGIGVTKDRFIHPIFGQLDYRLNGFLGFGLEDRVGSNFISAFILAGLLLSVGFILDNLYREKYLSKKRKLHKEFFSVVDFFIKAIKGRGGKLFYKRLLLYLLAIIQFVGLFLTFSYYSLLYLGLGLLVMGVMLRRDKLISLAVVYLMFFAVILPTLFSSGNVFFLQDNINRIEYFQKPFFDWIFGVSLGRSDFSANETNNSYFLIWSVYGVAGLLLMIRMLWRYFAEIYKKYRNTVNGERLWFVVATAIFGIFLLEGFSGNVLIFGPTAIIFWLMYGMILNFGNVAFKKKVN
ncbi:MAG: hypothetical protein ACOCUF_02135 [Patescibacteria group bacterium]